MANELETTKHCTLLHHLRAKRYNLTNILNSQVNVVRVICVKMSNFCRHIGRGYIIHALHLLRQSFYRWAMVQLPSLAAPRLLLLLLMMMMMMIRSAVLTSSYQVYPFGFFNISNAVQGEAGVAQVYACNTGPSTNISFLVRHTYACRHGLLCECNDTCS